MDLRAHVKGNGVELRNVHLESLGADPGGLVTADIGRVWYRTDIGRVRLCIAAATAVSLRREDVTIVNADIDAAAAIAYSKLNLAGSIVNADISGAAAIALSKLAVDPLARANHTGTQLASTISNFDTQVRTSRLDQMAVPTASVSMNSQKITNLADATGNTDAVTLQQLSSVSAGKDYKESCLTATAASQGSYVIASGAVTSITGLSAGSARGLISGVEPVNGSRILIKNAPAASGAAVAFDSTQPANGIYTVTGGTTTTVTVARATDADASAEVTGGMTTWVESGTAVAQTEWTLIWSGGATPPVLGTDGLQFAQTGTATAMTGASPINVTGTVISLNTQSPLGTSGLNLAITTAVPVSLGGTAGSNANAARFNLSAVGKYSGTYGDGVATSFSVPFATHGIADGGGGVIPNLVVTVYDITTPTAAVQVYPDVTVNRSTGAVTVGGFLTAPATNTVQIIITG